MLNSRYKATFEQLLRPIAASLARTGISPSLLTLAAPLLTSIVCLWFVRTRSVVPFCFVITAVACLDGLDGAVARASGKVSRFGAYLDALSDRYVEAIVTITVAYVTGYWLLSSIGLVGALLISYAKARAAMEVTVSNLEWPDLMERAERDVMFIIGLGASAVLPWKPLGHDLFWWTLVVLVVLIHVTVIQRILRARRLIRARSS